MGWEFVALVVACVVIGAALQRVSGMGVGLVTAPVMSIALGPVVGVTLSNAAASVTAAVLLVILRQEIDWWRFWRVTPLLLVGSLIGAGVVTVAKKSVLDTILGASVLIAIAAALGLQRHLNATGRFPALTSGAVAGFMNTTAGIAGPAITVYAIASRWEQTSLAATLQPVFLLANVTAITSKAAFGAIPGPDLVPWWAWLAAVAGAPIGIAVGTLLSRKVSLTRARTTAITIAAAGGGLALCRGLIGMFG